MLFIYEYILSQIFRDIDMDYHHIISNERNMPFPDEYMNVLRKHDRDSVTNISEDDHDDGMAEWIDTWFENTDHVSSHVQFLRAEATKKLYSGCSLTRLSSSLLILNLQSRFGWSNVSVTALLS